MKAFLCESGNLVFPHSWLGLSFVVLLDYSSYLGEVRVSLIFSLDKLKDLTLDFSRHFCFGQVKTVFPLKSARNLKVFSPDFVRSSHLLV